VKVLDLFSGIGGFSLGLDRAGFETVAFCEIEKYPRSVLKKHWPDVPIALDIRKLSYNFKTKQLFYKYKVIYVGSIELICGGFPCQPFSIAGKQAGKEDDRHLWPEMFRLIKEVRPSWVIGENVAGFIPMALDNVLFDLEGEGYETQSFVIPACAVGGIHRRDRVWIIANTDNDASRLKFGGCAKSEKQRSASSTSGRSENAPDSDRCADGEQHLHEASSQSNYGKRAVHDVANSEYGRRRKRREDSRRKARGVVDGCSGQAQSIMANANDQRLQREQVARGNEGVGARSNDQQFAGCDGSQPFRPIEPPTEPAVRHRDDGLPDNVARLKALGNAVVPQIPEMIGRAIMAIEAD